MEGSNQWKGAQTFVRQVHFLVLEPQPKGQASHLMHTWRPAGVLYGDGDWRAPSLYSTALQPVGIIFLFFFSFAFFFHFLFSFPVGTISTLFLCLCPLQLVGTIFVLSPSHTPGCQHLLEGSFYTHLVPQFLHLVPQFLLLPGGGS